MSDVPQSRPRLICPGCGGWVWPEAEHAPQCDNCYEHGWTTTSREVVEPEPEKARRVRQTR